jgi:hypothetical protein
VGVPADEVRLLLEHQTALRLHLLQRGEIRARGGTWYSIAQINVHAHAAPDVVNIDSQQ